MGADLAPFLVVAAAVIATPGQDTALTIKNTLAGGPRGGIFTALGVISGQLTWALAASVGLAGLLLASERAFIVLKLLGAAYLVYLGATALLNAARGHHSADASAGPAASLQPAAAYRQGVVSNLANPKIAVSFTSLLPQFVSSGNGSFATLLLLGVIFAGMTFVWLSGYAAVVAKAGDTLRRPRVRRVLDGATGLALVGLGARLAIGGHSR